MNKIDKIKKLRELTGISIIECKKALEEANDDLERASLILKQKLDQLSQEKIKRETKQGIVESYIHANKKIGVLIEILCETDFVAKSQEFQKLAHEICLQIAAQNPLYLKADNVPDEFLAGEEKIFQEQLKNSGKSEKLIDEIVKNKLKKYKEEISLMSQPWIKDETRQVENLIKEHIAKFGENIVVRRFVRYKI